MAIFYQYFPPDDVVSSVHFGDLASGLAQRGWDVTAYPCVWSCRGEGQRFPTYSVWKEVAIRRLWRPRFRQISSNGRILNAIWMIASWCWLATRIWPRPAVLIVGTDPALSVLVARVWKFLSPRTCIVHWCFDLYPEAAIADGLLQPNGLTARLLSRLICPAYAACSLIADLGPCMRRILAKYPSPARRETLVPWALFEPDAPALPSAEERRSIFDRPRLALLYSGTFGRAHSWQEILDLTERLEPHNIKVAFSVRGNRVAELQNAIRERGLDIPFVPFARADRLRDRLACADIHIVSLRKEWTGMVVPSKFFGALAAGRPVLFAGSLDSAVARWIQQFHVGWVLEQDNVERVSHQLIDYAASSEARTEMNKRCFATYRNQFSREVQIDLWNQSLRALISASTFPASAP